jgi:nitrogen fixation protein
LWQEELAGGKINLKEGQELKLVTDYTFKASQLRSVPASR